jgi:hypothetical protein
MVSAILNILAGILFLYAAFNPLGAMPGSGWLYGALAALFIIAGVWGLIG